MAETLLIPLYFRAKETQRPDALVKDEQAVALVRRLVLTLCARFPGAELVCDAATPLMVRLDNLHLVVTPVRARVHWGLAHGQDLETWGEGIRLLEEWFYFERPEPRLGSMQMMRHIPAIRKASGIFHWRLGEAAA